jgi:hypothetical protein
MIALHTQHLSAVFVVNTADISTVLTVFLILSERRTVGHLTHAPELEGFAFLLIRMSGKVCPPRCVELRNSQLRLHRCKLKIGAKLTCVRAAQAPTLPLDVCV